MKIKIEIEIHLDLTPVGIEDTLRIVAQVIGGQQYALTAGQVEIKGKKVATWRTTK